jgi:hypothetical protein
MPHMSPMLVKLSAGELTDSYMNRAEPLRPLGHAVLRQHFWSGGGLLAGACRGHAAMAGLDSWKLWERGRYK